TAAGKTLEQVLKTGCWDCHEWTNCPMAEAFGVHDLSGVPLLLRPRADQFVQLFDAGLIPRPEVPTAPACCSAQAPAEDHDQEAEADGGEATLTITLTLGVKASVADHGE